MIRALSQKIGFRPFLLMTYLAGVLESPSYALMNEWTNYTFQNSLSQGKHWWRLLFQAHYYQRSCSYTHTTTSFIWLMTAFVSMNHFLVILCSVGPARAFASQLMFIWVFFIFTFLNTQFSSISHTKFVNCKFNWSKAS